MKKLICYFMIIPGLLLTACSKQEVIYEWNLLLGLPFPKVPADNPMSKAKVELGRYLFYDKHLSANKQQACSSCHQQQYAFSDKYPLAIGSTGETSTRNSQTLVNIAYNTSFTWAHNGLMSIEQQLLIPMFGETPIELGISGHEKEILERFRASPVYQTLFDQAFPDEKINFQLVIKAIASFVRSLISFNSPFDRYAFKSDDSALSPSALRGMKLFFSEKTECHHCHGGFNFTQSTTHERSGFIENPFHNTGLYNLDGTGGFPANDKGLFNITRKPMDIGKYRAPSLRNIAVSAPYMHDGSLATLPEVIEFYSNGGRNISEGENKGDGRKSPLKSQFIKGFELTAQDKQDLVNFLHSLTDNDFLTNPMHSDPHDKTTPQH